MSSPDPLDELFTATHEPGGLAREMDRLFLHAMLDLSPDLIYFKDTHSRFLRINRALASFFGLSDPAEAIGKSDADFYSEAQSLGMLQDESRIMASGEALVDKIERQVQGDGRTVWMLTTKTPLCNESGRLVGTFGISRDITLLKEMEDALWNERNLLRSVIDNVPDFIFAKDAQGRYTLSNLAHARFLKKQLPDEVLGKSSFELFPREVAERSHADDLLVMENRQPLMGKVESPAPGQWLSTTKIPLFSNAGEVKGLVAIARDITLQKRASEELMQANVQLNNSREELLRAMDELRSVQLQLVEAEKMKMVGRLAAGVAHEVKNPLAIIGMGLEYLSRQTFEDPNIAIILQEIDCAVKRADSVVLELLDFSAPKNLNMVPADLHRLVRNALVLMRGEFSANHVAIEEELAPDLPELKLDAMKIEQVLVNLFSNAAHAMEGKGGVLTVRTSTRQVTSVGDNVGHADSFPLGARLVIIEVLDTGTGVPESMIGKVFEPFFTTKATGKGTGLGLAVTKTIIDLHGGNIEIGNRPEGGACVTITLNADTK